MFLVVPHAHVAAVGTEQKTAFLYLGRDPLHMLRIHRIVCGANGQGRHADVGEVSGAIPFFQFSGNTEFARALHGYVNGLVDVVEAAIHRVWPIFEAADMFFVKIRLQQFHVAGIGKIIFRFDRLDFGQYFRVHLFGEHLFGIFVVVRATHHHIRDNKPFQIVLVFLGVFHGENTAPAMAKQVKIVFVQPQCLSHLFHFLHKTRQIPQARVGRLVGVGRTELVVIIKFYAFLRQETLHALPVFVRAGRAAVQEQYFDAGVVAEAFCPDFVLAVFNRNEADAAGFHTGFFVFQIIAGGSGSSTVSRGRLIAGENCQQCENRQKEIFHIILI
ncbi:MAG: hypothetical protein EPGJADBJ_02466 [Saprospiraceae bacterium]|nr:hypothetical protein [Saprospiraceae bacterium]